MRNTQLTEKGYYWYFPANGQPPFLVKFIPEADGLFLFGDENTYPTKDFHGQFIGPQEYPDHPTRAALLTMAGANESPVVGPVQPAPTLRQLQLTLPWTIRYSQDFRTNPQTHKDFAHALHHVAKAAGKLHGLADDMDHDRTMAEDGAQLRGQYGKYIADLVVCALRAANVFPGGVIDLHQAVVDRIKEKNSRSNPD